MTKKAKLVQKVKAVKDEVVDSKQSSNEIDDLFSVFSSASSKNKRIPVLEVSEKEKKTVSITDASESSPEVTEKDLEGLEEDESENEKEDEEEAEAEAELVKGTPYNPKKDDFVPLVGTKSVDLDFFDSRGLKRKTRALTEDGLPIFTPKELKIGFGGGTDLCPFECNCCF